MIKELFERKQKKEIVLWFIFGVYFVFNLYLLLVHEMWRDEINVWLMARDLSFLQLFQELRYQGHPCLIYLVVMPFAKLGFPCQIMGYISFTIMMITAWLFIFKGPFSSITKFILMISPVFSYYYPVIARGYCLVALGTIILAFLFPRRYEKPIVYGGILGLLVQADTIAVPIAGLISLYWLMESIHKDLIQKKLVYFKIAWKGLWIPLGSALFYLLSMAKVSDSTEFQIRDLGLYDTIESIKGFSMHIGMRTTGLSATGCYLLFWIMLLLIALWICFNHKVFPWIVLIGVIFFQIVFSVFVYELNIWHFLILDFVILWTLWVINAETKSRNRIGECAYWTSQIFLALIGLLMFFHWNTPVGSNLQNALSGSYSDGYNAANYIKNNISTEELIVEVNIPFASTIWGYLPDYRPYYAGNGQVSTYADWSETQSQRVSFDEMETWIRKDFGEHQTYILIMSNGSCLTDWDVVPKTERFEILYETTNKSEHQEDYQIFRIHL